VLCRVVSLRGDWAWQGNPKGVMLTHQNVLANGTTYPVVARVGRLPGPRRPLHLLPPPGPHLREIGLATMFAQGVAVGFSSGKVELLVDDTRDPAPHRPLRGAAGLQPRACDSTLLYSSVLCFTVLN